MNRDHDNLPPALGDEAIDALAASWLAQREEGFTPEQEAEFLRWRLADPRHSAAVDRLEETCALLEQLPHLRNDPRLALSAAPAAAPTLAPAPTDASASRVRRARTAWLALGGVAAALLLGIFLSRSHEEAGVATATYATAPLGYQRVLLPDSSIAHLNGGTQLKVDFSARERRVELPGGEAHFNVAKMADRPFVVRAPGVRVVAVGTAFDVRVASAGVEVLVTEGVVRVERDDGVEPVVLGAGERSRLAAAAPAEVERVSPEQIRTVLAWQEPRLVFTEASLAEVVARFNARGARLELGDATLGARLVGGTFRPDDVETFVRLLESGGELVVERRDGNRIVIRQRHEK